MRQPNETNSTGATKPTRQIVISQPNAYFQKFPDATQLRNLVATITNGSDLVYVQGPPYNYVWIVRPGVSNPELILKKTTTPEGSPNVNFFIAGAFNKNGQLLAVADAKAHQIIVVDVVTNQIVYLIGGGCGHQDSKDGPVLFNAPSALVFSSTNDLYVSDFNNRCIRKITPIPVTEEVIDEKTQKPIVRTFIKPVVTTVAGSPLPVSSIPRPTPNSAASSDQNQIDLKNQLMSLSSMTAEDLKNLPPSFPLDGYGLDGRFQGPAYIALSSDEKDLYISDQTALRKLDLTTGQLTTVCGNPYMAGHEDKVGNNALFGKLGGLEVDRTGKIIVIDQLNCVLRQIDPNQGYSVTTIADRPAQPIKFKEPIIVTIDRFTGNLLVTERAQGEMIFIISKLCKSAIQDSVKLIYNSVRLGKLMTRRLATDEATNGAKRLEWIMHQPLARFGQLMMRHLVITDRVKRVEVIMHQFLAPFSSRLSLTRRKAIIDIIKNSFSNSDTRLRLRNLLGTLTYKSQTEIYRVLKIGQLTRTLKGIRLGVIRDLIMHTLSPSLDAGKRDRVKKLSQENLSNPKTKLELKQLMGMIYKEEWSRAAQLRKKIPDLQVVTKVVNNNVSTSPTSSAIAPHTPTNTSTNSIHSATANSTTAATTNTNTSTNSINSTTAAATNSATVTTTAANSPTTPVHQNQTIEDTQMTDTDEDSEMTDTDEDSKMTDVKKNKVSRKSSHFTMFRDPNNRKHHHKSSKNNEQKHRSTNGNC